MLAEPAAESGAQPRLYIEHPPHTATRPRWPMRRAYQVPEGEGTRMQVVEEVADFGEGFYCASRRTKFHD